MRLATLGLEAPTGSLFATMARSRVAGRPDLTRGTLEILRLWKTALNSAHPGFVKTEMGGVAADLELSEGGKTSAWLATLPDDGPTGGYIGEALPW
jgi:hypothetical protein